MDENGPQARRDRASHDNWLAERFGEHRIHLHAVAFRMLGSTSEADDAVQEAWLRVSRAETGGVENLGGWLTTVLARVCLDVLRTRKSHPEEPLEGATETAPEERRPDPEQEILLGDAVASALQVVLDTLGPAERVAFVLHDLFGVSFDDIAAILGCAIPAARQLASRARRRVQGAPAAESHPVRQREVVDAFLAAARTGDLQALLAVLHPEIVVRADASARRFGAAAETRGASEVAANFKGRAQGAVRALVDGTPGAAWIVGGKTRVVLDFTVVADHVVAIDLIGDPAHIGAMDLVLGNAGAKPL